MLIFPVSYILNDCFTEVWGYRKARLVIWIGFTMNLFVALMAMVAVALPAAPFWTGGEHFDFVFKMAQRVLLASLLSGISPVLLVVLSGVAGIVLKPVADRSAAKAADDAAKSGTEPEESGTLDGEKEDRT